MKIFIDFDDVVLNTGRFYRELKRSFVRGGIPGKVFDRDYLDYPVRSKSGLRKYNAREHLELIRKKGYDIRQARRNFEDLMNDISKYVFEDFPDFARWAGKQNIFLISYGDNLFQEEKIAKAGVRKFFRRVAVSDGSKAEIIQKFIDRERIAPPEKIIFLDDRFSQVAEIKRRMPTAVTFLVKRREGRYNDPKGRACDYEVKSLRGAAAILRRKHEK